MCNIKLIIVFCFVIEIVSTENVKAFHADSFVESLGVNVHWAYDNVYTVNYTELRTKLSQLGIRYVRDRTHPQIYLRANDLYKSFGIQTLLITGRYKPGPSQRVLDPSQVEQELNEIKTQAFVATVGIEGPNEYNIQHTPEPNWILNLRNYTNCLYRTAKADEMLTNLPLIGPSLTSLESYKEVGNLDEYIDYANVHMYFGDGWPGFPGWDVNGTRSIHWYLDDLARRQSPSGKRVQATETGYHNFMPHNGISEEAEGKYIVRSFMEFFRRGVYRTYKYELVDENKLDQQGHYGLLRANLTEKHSFKAIKNLIDIFNDKGSQFETNSLNYTLDGTTNDTRQILFQKRNGDFYLVVWLEVESWNTTTHTDIYPSLQHLSMIFENNQRISKGILYALDNYANINIQNLTITNNRINFNATDKISVMKLISNKF